MSELGEFTKNFVNQNNFIQNQHLIAHKKRLKTESQYQGIELIDRMKSLKELSRNRQERISQDKMTRVRVEHKKHREMLTLSSKEKKDQEIEQKKYRSEQNKLNSAKKEVKKIRLTFAEECYPIIGKKKVSQK